MRFFTAGKTTPAQPVQCRATGNHRVAANDEPEPLTQVAQPGERVEVRALPDVDALRKAALL
ncbi:MAG: hypothetical protein K0S48_34 [Ramlibacter sp.]|jgi:hypothetical protein|nr:hypothetical protein [Ramlibacter sp.]